MSITKPTTPAQKENQHHIPLSLISEIPSTNPMEQFQPPQIPEIDITAFRAQDGFNAELLDDIRVFVTSPMFSTAGLVQLVIKHTRNKISESTIQYLKEVGFQIVNPSSKVFGVMDTRQAYFDIITDDKFARMFLGADTLKVFAEDVLTIQTSHEYTSLENYIECANKLNLELFAF